MQASGAYPQFYVSIHAPARGATMVTLPTQTAEASFNSRSREGSDRADMIWSGLAVDVSIHAPARGATDSLCLISLLLACFNSRSREGSDPPRPASPALCPRFNSRSREGSDSPSRRMTPSTSSFNSRSREGSDGISSTFTSSPSVSIHAPARGATVRRWRTRLG